MDAEGVGGCWGSKGGGGVEGGSGVLRAFLGYLCVGVARGVCDWVVKCVEWVGGWWFCGLGRGCLLLIVRVWGMDVYCSAVSGEGIT